MYEQMLKGDAAYSLHYQMADIVIMLLMQMTKKAKDHWAQCLQQICWVTWEATLYIITASWERRGRRREREYLILSHHVY